MLQENAADLVIGAAVGKDGRHHHYIPKLYLKGWGGPNEKVCEYSRPFKAVKTRHVHPTGTGYEPGLNTIPNSPDPRVTEYIEDEFLTSVDSTAALVLERLRDKSAPEIAWTSETRSAWSRFILSLMMRTPEYVKALGAEVAHFYDPSNKTVNDIYRNIKRPEDPETYAQHIAESGHPAGRASALALETLIDSEIKGGHLNNMRWDLIQFSNPKHTLLTSDRPIIMTNGMARPEGHLALPIGPFTLFIATNMAETEHIIRNKDPRELMKHVNDRVASQARKYVWGVDAAHLRFVENRLGKMLPSTPLEVALLGIHPRS